MSSYLPPHLKLHDTLSLFSEKTTGNYFLTEVYFSDTTDVLDELFLTLVMYVDYRFIWMLFLPGERPGCVVEMDGQSMLTTGSSTLPR